MGLLIPDPTPLGYIMYSRGSLLFSSRALCTAALDSLTLSYCVLPQLFLHRDRVVRHPHRHSGLLVGFHAGLGVFKRLRVVFIREVDEYAMFDFAIAGP